MKNLLKNYSYDYDNQIYMLKIYSDQPDDWEIWVYDEDKVTLLEKITNHDLIYKLPNSLMASIQLEIGRGQKNIAADKDTKSS
jgi:hypothetical protein